MDERKKWVRKEGVGELTSLQCMVIFPHLEKVDPQDHLFLKKSYSHYPLSWIHSYHFHPELNVNMFILLLYHFSLTRGEQK